MHRHYPRPGDEIVFTSFNDTFGHLVGDDCIRRVSGILVAEARNTGDRVFRFGGEEFIILLIGIDLLTAISVAERIRREIVVKRIPHKPPTALNYVTVSFGIASSKVTPNFDLDALNGEADSALYEAKKNDFVLIIGVTKDHAGWLPPKAWEWIKERQAVAA